MLPSTRTTNTPLRATGRVPRRGAFGTYSPSRRTGLIFSGTGTHGAYHAGVLRALQEAGVRVDVVAGHGIGAATAILAAIEGGSKLWDKGGLWSPARAGRYYRWRWPLRSAGYLAALLALVCTIPFIVLALGALVYAAGFVVSLLGLDAGTTLVTWVSGRIAEVFAGSRLPTVVPRLVMLIVIALAAVLAGSVFLATPQRDGMGRVVKARWWWRVLAGALDTSELRRAVTRAAWDLVRGAATAGKPTDAALSRRYSEVLTDNLGQPGCRELMIAVADLDARRDIVGALLADDHQERFFASQPGRERSAEVVDLGWVGRDMVVDFLGAALTPAIGAEPHSVAFPAESYWRGEVHRGCDRPGMVGRLLLELKSANVGQCVVVSAAAPPASPHRLNAPLLDPRARLGEFLTTAEASGLDDAIGVAHQQFEALFVICPSHNPLGPFESTGTYDQGSDRRRAIDELLQQGYQDAYQQFIDPAVGASGDELAPAMT